MAQGFQRFQNAGQAFLPRAFGFEVGFNRLQAHGCGCGGQQLSRGADLQGQGAGPGLLGGFGAFKRFGVVFTYRIGL